jgi:hypothetical protein
MKICGKEIKIHGRLIRVARLADEGFDFLEDPEAGLADLGRSRSGIDIFTFTQRLPNVTPAHTYPMEWDNVAALPVSTFENWWKQQIDGKTRNMVRRGEKKGVVLREVAFDDMLARGIWEIYNECPVRQGRPFPHYGKDFDTVRTMSATFLDRSVFIGAFLDEKLIGFVKLTADETRSQATVMHIIAMVQHRDKAPTNALLAQAVQSCEKMGVAYLVYSNFAYGKKQRDSLSDFKENNGFQRIDLPRYYVPMTATGRAALRLGLHHGLLQHLPEPLLAKLRGLRTTWLSRRAEPATQPSQTGA